MRLGEVFDQVDTQRPKPRRWLGRVLFLLALGGIGATLYLHGPGVLMLKGGQIAVVQNQTGFDLLGPPTRIVRQPGVLLYAPVIHQVQVLKSGEREVLTKITARSQDGVAIAVTRLGATFQIDSEHAPRVLREIGTQGKDLDAYVASTVQIAFATAFRAYTVDELTQEETRNILNKKVKNQIKRQLKDAGFRVRKVREGRWSMGGPLQTLHAEVQRSAQRVITLQLTAQRHRDDAGKQRAAVNARREEAHTELRHKLAADLDTAQEAAAQAIRDAERYAVLRAADAKAQSQERRIHAKAEAEISALRSQAIATRAAALTANGSRLLDQVIAEHVLPQLAQIRARPSGVPLSSSSPAQVVRPAPVEPEP